MRRDIRQWESIKTSLASLTQTARMLADTIQQLQTAMPTMVGWIEKALDNRLKHSDRAKSRRESSQSRRSSGAGGSGFGSPAPLPIPESAPQNQSSRRRASSSRENSGDGERSLRRPEESRPRSSTEEMPPPPPTWRRLAAPRDPPEVAEQALPRAPISTSTLNSTSVPEVAQGTCSPTVTTGSSSEQTTTMPLPATFNFEAYQRFMEFEALRAQMLSATPSTSNSNMALEIQQSPIPEAPVGATLYASQPPVAPREEASVTLDPLMPPVLLQRP